MSSRKPLGGVDRDAPAAEEVAHGHVQALEVAPVVGVGVADDDGVELVQAYVQLQVGQDPGPASSQVVKSPQRRR